MLLLLCDWCRMRGAGDGVTVAYEYQSCQSCCWIVCCTSIAQMFGGCNALSSDIITGLWRIYSSIYGGVRMSISTGAVATYIQILRQHTPDLQARYALQQLGIFGSYRHDRQTAASDLDVLVRFQPDAHPTLLTIAALELELRDLLGVPVDLVLEEGLRGEIGRRIRAEVLWL